MKPFREGERRSRRNLGLAPESKAEDLPVRSLRSHKLYVILIFEFDI